MTNSLFEPPVIEVGKNVRSSSIARWKACGRLPMSDIIEHFSVALMVETLYSFVTKNACD